MRRRQSAVLSGIVLVLLVLVAAPVCAGKTVGLWKDRRSYITDGMLKTLEEAGWVIDDRGVRRNAAGEVLTFEFLDDGPSFERVILPFIVLRRLDQVLASTREAVWRADGAGAGGVLRAGRRVAGDARGGAGAADPAVSRHPAQRPGYPGRCPAWGVPGRRGRTR